MEIINLKLTMSPVIDDAVDGSSGLVRGLPVAVGRLRQNF